jgi:hypothetical protein
MNAAANDAYTDYSLLAVVWRQSHASFALCAQAGACVAL